MIRYLLGYLWIILLTLSPLIAQEKYQYSYIPKKLYSTEVFPVTILALDTKMSTPLDFSFDKRSKTKPLDREPLKVSNGKNTFYTFYFKAKSDNFHLPKLLIKDINGTHILKKRLILVKKLDIPYKKSFCGVIASDFKIKTAQVSAFDKRHNLIDIIIEAHEANLEDMSIPNVIEDGIDSIQRRGSFQTIEYYFVIPSKIHKVTFNYYNVIKEQFVPITISTRYEHTHIKAIQSNLNPKDSSFSKLKKYTFGGLSIFFLLMFFIYRDAFYLILLIMAGIIFLTFFVPLEKVCVKARTPLYILPINTSTIGATIKKQTMLPVLNQYKHYYKVRYKDEITGWIKNEDICQN